MRNTVFYTSLGESHAQRTPAPAGVSAGSRPTERGGKAFTSPTATFTDGILPIPKNPAEDTPFKDFTPVSLCFFKLYGGSAASYESSFTSSYPTASLGIAPIIFSACALTISFPAPVTPPPVQHVEGPGEVRVDAEKVAGLGVFADRTRMLSNASTRVSVTFPSSIFTLLDIIVESKSLAVPIWCIVSCNFLSSADIWSVSWLLGSAILVLFFSDYFEGSRCMISFRLVYRGQLTGGSEGGDTAEIAVVGPEVVYPL